MFKLRRLMVAFVVASFVVPAFAFAVTPKALAVEAAATHPTEDTCTSAAKNRARTEGPECTVTVECPVDSAGCAFSARGTFESKRTIGTAQGRLRVTNPNQPDFGVDFVCSSPAAISAKDAGCTVMTPTVFVPPGTVFDVTCTWIGSTVSVNPRVTCEAAMQPLGEE